MGFGVLTYLSVLWLMGQSIGNRPLLILGALLLLVGVQLVSAGLVAEMLTRQNNQLRKNYLVSEIRRAGHEFKPSRIVSFSTGPTASAGTEPVVERGVGVSARGRVSDSRGRH
jgi:hypothetical protein